MFLKIYEEIKHPYKKKNLSYKLFRYSGYLLLVYFINSFAAYSIALGFKLDGNMIQFENILKNSVENNVILGSLAVLCFLISVVFRKKI